MQNNNLENLQFAHVSSENFCDQLIFRGGKISLSSVENVRFNFSETF